MTDRELMQQALDAFEYHVETAEVEDKRIEAAIYALRTVLAQPEQEPVAWYHAEEYKTHFTTEPTHDLIGKYWQPLYTAPRPWVGLDALETVYKIIIDWDECGGKRSRRELARRIVDLYAAPPQRPWVGLTDEELRDIAGYGPDYFDWKAFGRAIEAKLKEKNT